MGRPTPGRADPSEIEQLARTPQGQRRRAAQRPRRTQRRRTSHRRPALPLQASRRRRPPDAPPTTRPARSPNPGGCPAPAAPSPTPASPRSTRSPRPPATTRPWTPCCCGCTPRPPAAAAAPSRCGRSTSTGPVPHPAAGEGRDRPLAAGLPDADAPPATARRERGAPRRRAVAALRPTGGRSPAAATTTSGCASAATSLGGHPADQHPLAATHHADLGRAQLRLRRRPRLRRPRRQGPTPARPPPTSGRPPRGRRCARRAHRRTSSTEFLKHLPTPTAAAMRPPPSAPRRGSPAHVTVAPLATFQYVAATRQHRIATCNRARCRGGADAHRAPQKIADNDASSSTAPMSVWARSSEPLVRPPLADLSIGLLSPHSTTIRGFTSVFCVTTTIDHRGRLADRSPVRTLGWAVGQPVTSQSAQDHVVLAADAVGEPAVNRQGFLKLPRYGACCN